MTPHRLDPVLRHVRGVGVPPADDQPDAALLADFARSGDEAAFAVLVRRHGPMVLGLCRRLLADIHTAEDAFQATFLVLAKKARWLRHPDRLGPWLYGVARRVALKARAAASRRREVAAVDAPAPIAAEPTDLRPVIDAAIAALPSRYRDPVVLCYLQGLTNTEAAARLRCPLGTVATRLSRARDRLRVLLTRRGIVPAVGALTAALTPDATASMVPDELLRTTTRWAAALSAGPVAAAAIPTNILTLTKQVTQAMILDKLRVVAVLVAFGVAGAGVALSRQTGGEPAKPEAPPAAKAVEPARQGERPLPLALLRQKPPDAYRIDAGDVLGVFIEGILGERGAAPPLTTLPVDQSNRPGKVPMMGYPILVHEDGTLHLPLLDPIDVRGKTVVELQQLMFREYTQRRLVSPGTRVFAALAKPRTYRVTLIYQDPQLMGGWGPKSYALDLPAYENDVLTAMSRSGVSTPTAAGSIVIQRDAVSDGRPRDRGQEIRQVQIPMRVQADQPLPFKPDDVILKGGDVVIVDLGRDPRAEAPRPSDTERAAVASPVGPVAVTLAVAAPDGRVLVQMPAGSWKLFDAAKLSATDTDGKPVAAVADRLKAMTAVLVTTDGKPPAAQYLQLVKPGTLVLILKD